MLLTTTEKFDSSHTVVEAIKDSSEDNHFYQSSGFSTHHLLSAKEENDICRNMQYHALTLVAILVSREEGTVYLADMVESIADGFRRHLNPSESEALDTTFKMLGLIDDVQIMLHTGDTKRAGIKTRKLMACFASWAPAPYLVFRQVANRDLRRLDEQSQVAVNLAMKRYIANRNRMATANLRLVLSIASKYKNLGTQYDDLVQEGYLGLIKSIERFDYRLGFRFSTYAYRAISQSIHLAVHKNSSLVRKPFKKMKENRVIESARESLEQRLGRKPTLKDIAGYVSKPIDTVNSIVVSQNITTVDPKSDSSDVMDYLYSLGEEHHETDKRIHHSADMNVVRKKMLSLRKRDQLIVFMRFGIGCRKDHTLEEIAMQMGLTKERVRQIVNTSVEKIKSDLSLNDHVEGSTG